MTRFSTVKFKFIAILVVISFITTSCATSSQFKKMEDPDLFQSYSSLKTNSGLGGIIFLGFFCGIVGVIPAVIYYFATRDKQIKEIETELTSRGYVNQNGIWIKPEISPSPPSIPPKEEGEGPLKN